MKASTPLTSNLRYGFIGCGMMGHEHLRNLALIPGSAVTRIFEPDDGMAASAIDLAAQGQHGSGVKPQRAASLAEVVQAGDVDALVITSPNFRHAEQLRAIAALRALPILIEKPVCTHEADADDLQRLGASYGAPIWVAMEYRYMPPVAALIEAVRNHDKLGQPHMLTIREHRFPFLQKVGDWNRFNANTGGTFVEKCCHFFDLMRLITGSEPVRIQASIGQAHNHLDERYQGATPDIDDHGYVLVDFANGQRAMLELCMFAEGSRYQEEICVVGTRAKVECLVPGPGRFWPSHLGPAPVPRLVWSPRDPQGPVVIDVPVDPAALAAGDHNGSTLEQHRRFRAAALGLGPVEVSLADGLAAVRMGLKAHRVAQASRLG